MKFALRIVLAAVTLVSGVSFATSPAIAAPAECTSHNWYGLIGARYEYFGGSAGVLGCPTTEELEVSEGRGRIQYFDRGVITWSPATGPNSVQTLWKAGNGQLLFDWYTTDPLNYNDWLLNVRFNGTDRGLDREMPVGQNFDVFRTAGRTAIGTVGSGSYRVAVEGCDRSGGGTHTCRQGWTNPLYLMY
ncbi:hypothetical protein OG943_04180 [Amycolatopsis sp. NBC_00345]|uniref:LGFP repeat-containing protein n=1 Tax=Amycolatopsis sp. NBC_00345 TaxID=2975955 RepID=UPI002E2694E7